MKSKMNKKKIFLIWFLFVIIILLLYFLKHDFFQPENLKNLFEYGLILGLFIYFVLGSLRGFTFLPVTIMIFAGILVFPPIPLFIINLICILISSTIVYFWGEYLGFDKYFNKKYPKQVLKLKSALNERELPVIALWSFFPFVPTDLICYTSEILKIKLGKCLLGVAIGEGIICAIYIFGGSSILHYFFIF